MLGANKRSAGISGKQSDGSQSPISGWSGQAVSAQFGHTTSLLLVRITNAFNSEGRKKGQAIGIGNASFLLLHEWMLDALLNWFRAIDKEMISRILSQISIHPYPYIRFPAFYAAKPRSQEKHKEDKSKFTGIKCFFLQHIFTIIIHFSTFQSNDGGTDRFPIAFRRSNESKPAENTVLDIVKLERPFINSALLRLAIIGGKSAPAFSK